MSMVH